MGGLCKFCILLMPQLSLSSSSSSRICSSIAMHRGSLLTNGENWRVQNSWTSVLTLCTHSSERPSLKCRASFSRCFSKRVNATETRPEFAENLGVIWLHSFEFARPSQIFKTSSLIAKKCWKWRFCWMSAKTLWYLCLTWACSAELPEFFAQTK